MMDHPLGRLERVELRDIWTSEATDFTPWLARPENLQVLSETLAIDLELEAQEKSVGPFRADILCTDIGTDQWVLIENQLERTDDTYLGQLLTYAAGMRAVRSIDDAKPSEFCIHARVGITELIWLDGCERNGVTPLLPLSRHCGTRSIDGFSRQ